MENSIKIINYILNFVYDELKEEFIKQNGNCNNSTYNLINWDYILDSNNCLSFFYLYLYYKNSLNYDDVPKKV
jgi:hypothetical protein